MRKRKDSQFSLILLPLSTFNPWNALAFLRISNTIWQQKSSAINLRIFSLL